jgi:nucleoside-diphosphate-sugar epimerase
MRLLVIGGTVFVGRAVVELALERGDEVTIFHRGEHGADLFGGVERILGDRTTDLGRLAGRAWDVVVDTCAFVPGHVGTVDCGRYVLVSTAGVYRDWPEHPVPDEDAPLHQTGDDYSALKAACERAAEAAMPGRVAAVRPGIIFGPHENIGRLPWWLDRMARGGPILAPGPPDAPFQYVDVRDLARLLLDAQPGPRNAVGPPVTWGELLETVHEVAGAPGSELVWTDARRVHAAIPDSWDVLPVWPAPDVPAAYAVGTKHPYEARTVRDTVEAAWRAMPEERRVPGLDPDLERRILAGTV